MCNVVHIMACGCLSEAHQNHLRLDLADEPSRRHRMPAVHERSGAAGRHSMHLTQGAYRSVTQ